ncbi:MAG: 16S rRNA (adenine(1518)-N(6)/adenine(1519)-N(6))-dimethyltransferase RsmA [Bacteroidales bacterium]|nr:16S rRNA (adenine(1518)-N(6)/adenine(1519)-N(6))-dimethyltransferase RsmA [Bacteroidales bacterium]
MQYVNPKKSLGQHFLKDENIAQKIVGSLTGRTSNILEIGPGMGVLSKYLISNPKLNIHLIETDRESVAYLKENYPEIEDQITKADFLKFDLKEIFTTPFSIIGNFPYNISSQIFFKVLEYNKQIPEVVGMIQKEVAVRIASPPGNKQYGILSVLLQAFYNIELLFSVSNNVFVPPPNVQSAVIRLTRNNTTNLECDEKLFFKVVKAGFNQRRKTLRNALSSLHDKHAFSDEIFNKRAEQLSVEDFVRLTNIIGEYRSTA